MQHFDSTKMSDDEYEFIRLYCNVIKTDYPQIVQINHLTDPANLGVDNIVDAAVAAKKLQAMQAEFAERIESLGEISAAAAKKYADPEVSYKQIATVFTQSFFKIIDSATKHALVFDKTTPQHDGWSSGHPLQWQKVIKSLNDIYIQKQEHAETHGHVGLINALINLFSILPKYTKDDTSYYKFNTSQSNAWEEYDPWDGYDYDEEDDDDSFYSQ